MPLSARGKDSARVRNGGSSSGSRCAALPGPLPTSGECEDTCSPY
jgi:hypothetical protein